MKYRFCCHGLGFPCGGGRSSTKTTFPGAGGGKILAAGERTSKTGEIRPILLLLGKSRRMIRRFGAFRYFWSYTGRRRGPANRAHLGPLTGPGVG